MNTQNVNLTTFLDIWHAADGRFLQEFFDNSEFLKVNYTFCYENFAPQAYTTEIAADGSTSFTIKQKKPSPDVMAKYKAAMARNIGKDVVGSSIYSGTVMPFGDALTPVDVLQVEQWEKIEKQFGNANSVLKDWMSDVQRLLNSADSLLSNQAGQLLSTGKIEGRNSDTGEVMYVQDALVPPANKVTAGEKAWTAADCDILDQMRKLENDYRERTGDDQDLEWGIPLYMWRNIFLNNANLKAKVIEWRTVRELPISSGGSVLEEWVTAYVNSLGLTSPIRIMKEGEVQQDPINSGFHDKRKDVKGWDDKVAILKPAGMAGEIVKGEIQKASIFSKHGNKSNATAKYNIAYVRQGLFAVITSVTNDANGMPVLHVDLEGNAAPALTCAPYLTIVDTSTADS